MRELSIALTNELAGALIDLREPDETLEAAAARVVIEARAARHRHVSEPPAGGTGSHENTPAT